MKSNQSKAMRKKIREADLLMQGGPFLPVCFCLDTSVSMLRTIGGTPVGKYSTLGDGVSGQVVRGGVSRLEQIQEMLDFFCRSVYAETAARGLIEYAVVTYDSRSRLLRPFARTERIVMGMNEALVGDGLADIPVLTAAGQKTVLGEGVCTALQAIDACVEQYKNAGVSFYRPWLILVGDGQGNGLPKLYAQSQQMIHKRIKEGRLSVFPLCMGDTEDVTMFDGLSPHQPTIRITSADLPLIFTRLAAEGRLKQNMKTVTHPSAIPCYHDNRQTIPTVVPVTDKQPDFRYTRCTWSLEQE